VGASAARNRALREAKHEIVAFSDDDAVPDRGWLRSLIRNFCDPLVLCVTGLTMPLELETKAQEWFELYSPHGRGFSRVVFDGSLFDALNAAPVGVSANMALRRTVVEHVGFFDEALGPGTPAKCGEDYELFSQILRAGYRIVYDPSALSWHRHRRTWRNFRKTIYGYGVGVYAFWTRALLVDKEWHTLQHAWWWFRNKQLPNLVRSLLRRPDRVPLVLLLAELWGCIIGPGAYFVSRWRLKQERSKLS
jgi:cellulose synthase/poly-beta-1,6-N-acetylglucosamine synthase-like glycosyltransferase